MEYLAIGLSLISLLYFFLFFLLQYWISLKEEGDYGTYNNNYERTRRKARFLLRKLYNTYVKNDSRRAV